MRFPISLQQWHRLPRHPDWRYELIDGHAVLSPRPRPLYLRRDTALPVSGSSGIVVREFDARTDRAAVAALLSDVWLAEDPYRSLEDPEELLHGEIVRSLDTAAVGAVAVESGPVCAAALVDHGRSSAPVLTWLTVAPEARERGLATALLRHITGALCAEGAGELASATSSANTPSLRWHLSRGFQLAPDPLREALRPNGDAYLRSTHRPAV